MPSVEDWIVASVLILLGSVFIFTVGKVVSFVVRRLWFAVQFVAVALTLHSHLSPFYHKYVHATVTTAMASSTGVADTFVHLLCTTPSIWCDAATLYLLSAPKSSSSSSSSSPGTSSSSATPTHSATASSSSSTLHTQCMD